MSGIASKMGLFGATVELSKSESRAWKLPAFLKANPFSARRVRRVLFATMKLSDREDSASVIAGASSCDTIGKRPFFGLRNVDGGDVRRRHRSSAAL